MLSLMASAVASPLHARVGVRVYVSGCVLKKKHRPIFESS